MAVATDLLQLYGENLERELAAAGRVRGFADANLACDRSAILSPSGGGPGCASERHLCGDAQRSSSGAGVCCGACLSVSLIAEVVVEDNFSAPGSRGQPPRQTHETCRTPGSLGPAAEKATKPPPTCQPRNSSALNPPLVRHSTQDPSTLSFHTVYSCRWEARARRRMQGWTTCEPPQQRHCSWLQPNSRAPARAGSFRVLYLTTAQNVPRGLAWFLPVRMSA